MDPGSFSLSLNVQNLKASRLFYGTLGFEAVDGDGKTWTRMEREGTTIGLYEGILEQNCMTFTPTDARAVASELVKNGYEIDAGRGGGDSVHFVVTDPDGNQLLFDQT